MRKIILPLVVCLFFSILTQAQNNVIDQELQQILNQKNDELIDINILLKQQMPAEHLTHLNAKSDSKEVRREIVINELKKFSEQQQESVMAVIEAEAKNGNVTDINAHWLVNSINCKASRDVVYQLASHPDVKVMGLNKEDVVTEGYDENDAASSRGTIASHVTHIQAEKVWDLGYTGKGVTVAVLDSGCNLDHVDIKDHLWTGNANGGYNFVNPGQRPMDNKGHGSHCAGIVCGDGTSGVSTGIAPDATLMVLKVNDTGGTEFDVMVEAIEYAVENGADIISISIGWWAPEASRKETFRELFENALEANVVVAAAAGNNRESLATYPAPNNINSPADCPPPYLHEDQTLEGGISAVISVGGVDEDNNIIGVSSQGPVTWQNTTYGDYAYNPGMGLIRPDIVAQGASVKSLAHNSNTDHAIKAGTSMAAPAVAGVMALMLEKNPDLTPAELCRIIEETATPLSQTKSNDFGSGCINALAAVQAVSFDVQGAYLNKYNYTRNFNTGTNQNLELTLVNNGAAATSGATTVTLTSNDSNVTVDNGSATISNTIAVNGTATCNFTINVSNSSPDNHVAKLTVTTSGDSNNSFEIEINISNELVAPSNITSQVQNLRDINLSWEATNNATSYNVYRDGSYIANTASTSYSDAGLEYGTLYTYTITSKRNELESESSREIRVLTGDNPETPSPTNVTVANNNTVSWTNSTDSKSSNVYRKESSSEEVQLASKIDGNSYTDSDWNTLPNGIYQYGVSNNHASEENIYKQDFTDLNLTTSTSDYEETNAYWYQYKEGNYNNNNWSIATNSTTTANNTTTTFEAYMGKAAFIKSQVNKPEYLNYLVSRQMNYTQYAGSNAKLSFYYITPAWGKDVNTLKVMVSTSSYTGTWTEIWSSNTTDVSEWTKAEVNLSNYIDQTFYIAFVNVAGYGYCTGLDEVSINVEGSKESRIQWSGNIYKGVNVFAQDGDMNNGDNWATNSTPSASDNVIIDANAVINGTVEVNSLTINEGASLTLNVGAKLIVNGDFVNTDADAFIINDGAQVIQNNEDVAATFNMNIVNPTEWSSNNKTGWQFIASPVKESSIFDFTDVTGDYDLYRYDGNKEMEWINHKDESNVDEEEEPTVPAAPEVTAEAISSTSIQLTWEAVDGATSYNVYSVGNIIATITETNHTVGYLSPNKEYCFSVSAVNELGESAQTEACATTPNAKPITPYEFTATATGESTIELSWSLANRATSYNVYQGNDKIATVTETTYTVEGLEPETNYCFTVTAQNEMGESDKTEEKCATTEESIPDAPVVTATATSHNEILLSWEAVKGATKYNIYSAGFLIDETTETNYTVTPVAANTETCIIVRAANSKGESGDAEACATTKPYAPTNLTATAKGTSSIKLSWADSNNGVTYNIYQGSSLIAENIETRDFTVEGLEKSTEYCFTVKAVNEVSGESLASNEACATTKEQDDEPGTIQESITVGNGGSTTTALPFATSYAYSISQQIYTFEDVEQTGNITGIAFQYKSGASGTRSIDVYMKHSNIETFAIATSWESMTNEYKVYSGNIVISGTADEWVGVTFDTPFAYTGGNFVLCVYDHTNSTLSGTTFHADQVSGKSLCYYSGMFPAPLDPSNVNKNGFMFNFRNNIKLSFAEGGQDPEIPETPTVPAAPVVTSEATSYNTATFTWEAVEGATSYKVYSGTYEIAEVTDPVYYASNLSNYAGTEVCFTFTAVNEHGESEATQACVLVYPAVPKNLVATANETTITLTWSAVTGAESYNVYSGTETVATGLTDETFTTEELAAGEYCYTVTAVNASGESVASTEQCATIEEQGGDEPEPTPDPEGDVCTIELILSDKYSDGWDGSTLTVSATDGTSEVLTLESGKKSETYSVEIVSGSHVTITYHPSSGYYVYPAENSFVVRYQSGLEIYSVAENTLVKGEDHVYEFDVDCAPKAPESPVVKAKATETTIVLTWDAVIGAESYKVYRDAEQLAEGLTETTYTITGLTPETEYTFSVIAANEVGNSEPTVITVKTKSDNLEVVTIEIGEESGLTTMYSPVYDYYKSYSVSQTIYTSNEIGVTSGTITSISYKNSSGNNNTRNIAVYLKNVDRNSFATKEWETLTSDLCVYDGSFTFGTNDWVTIEFTDEFEYDGRNLLVCIVDKTGSSVYSSYDTFSAYEVSQTESESRAVFGEYKSYGTPINPLDLTNTASAPTYVRTSLGGTTYSYRAPLVKFEIEVNSNANSKSATREVSSVSPSRGAFETAFQQGVGYMASYEKEKTATFKGNLNHENSYEFPVSYNSEKDLANFHLLGNPFPFDMDMNKATFNNMVEGFAIVTSEGGYDYSKTTIPVGDGFFVKATKENPSFSYNAASKATRGEKTNSLNVIATSNAGVDNMVINFAGESEGFPKLQNFNDAIATVYVQDNGTNYGIYNCNADVQEVELNFNANQMGSYTISIEPNGKFQTVTLVDLFTNIETNMLIEDYHFTAMSDVNNNRFIVKLAVGDQQSAVSDNFVYQSGEELIVEAEGTVQIIDIMGRVVYSDDVESTNNRIDVSGFRNGTYVVRVINESEIKVEKVVIY